MTTPFCPHCGCPRPDPSNLPDTLSPAERRVVQAIIDRGGAWITGPSLAAESGVTLNSAKVHVHHAIAKGAPIRGDTERKGKARRGYRWAEAA